MDCMSRPSTSTWPELALSNPARMRRAVVLPQPDGPKGQRTHPARCPVKSGRAPARCQTGNTNPARPLTYQHWPASQALAPSFRRAWPRRRHRRERPCQHRCRRPVRWGVREPSCTSSNADGRGDAGDTGGSADAGGSTTAGRPALGPPKLAGAPMPAGALGAERSWRRALGPARALGREAGR